MLGAHDGRVHRAHKLWDTCYGGVSSSGLVRIGDLRQLMGDTCPGFRVYFALPGEKATPAELSLIITAIDWVP